MARAKSESNGILEVAIATLLQNQATLVQTQTSFLAQVAENEHKRAKLEQEMIAMDRTNSERFARIEAILLDHSRILQSLTDAVREKIGFRAPT